MTKKKKVLLGTAGFLVLLGIIGSFGEEPAVAPVAAPATTVPLMTPSSTSTTSASPSTTSTPTTTTTAPKPTPVSNMAKAEAALKKVNRGAVLTEADFKAGKYMIEFPVMDMISMKLTRKTADVSMMQMLKELHATGLPMKGVGLKGTFPLIDNYGNESKGQVIWSYWEADTLAKINWAKYAGISPEKAADAYALHPDLR